MGLAAVRVVKWSKANCGNNHSILMNDQFSLHQLFGYL